VDKSNHPSPPFGSDKTTDPKSIPAQPARAGSSVVFCGDPAQVRTGFALALQLMGIDAPLPDVSERDPPKTEAND
jgi:hypothetical protein